MNISEIKCNLKSDIISSTSVTWKYFYPAVFFIFELLLKITYIIPTFH